MNNLNLDDLYQIILDRLRKDRKGAVNVEEFESFLKYRNLDYFNKQLSIEDVTKRNHDSLAVFTVYSDAVGIIDWGTEELSTELRDYYAPLTDTFVHCTAPDYDVAHIINAWYVPSGSSYYSDRIKCDLVSAAEWQERMGNAITGPSNTHPICMVGWHEYDNGVDPALINIPVLWIAGTAGTVDDGYMILDYFRQPAEPYFDYYTDASGNITYLTDGQSAYTLQTEEIARDGSVAGEAVTSASEDLEWSDHDAINILDMVYSDIVLALSDPDSFQASMVEREQNVSS